MTSAQVQKLALTVIKNDPQAIRPFILLLYGLREARGDPATLESMLNSSLGALFIESGAFEELSLKEYVSLAA